MSPSGEDPPSCSPSRYWQPVNILCGMARQRRTDVSIPGTFRFPREPASACIYGGLILCLRCDDRVLSPDTRRSPARASFSSHQNGRRCSPLSMPLFIVSSSLFSFSLLFGAAEHTGHVQRDESARGRACTPIIVHFDGNASTGNFCTVRRRWTLASRRGRHLRFNFIPRAARRPLTEPAVIPRNRGYRR